MLITVTGKTCSVRRGHANDMMNISRSDQKSTLCLNWEEALTLRTVDFIQKRTSFLKGKHCYTYLRNPLLPRILFLGKGDISWRKEPTNTVPVLSSNGTGCITMWMCLYWKRFWNYFAMSCICSILNLVIYLDIRVLWGWQTVLIHGRIWVQTTSWARLKILVWKPTCRTNQLTWKRFWNAILKTSTRILPHKTGFAMMLNIPLLLLGDWGILLQVQSLCHNSLFLGVLGHIKYGMLMAMKIVH